MQGNDKERQAETRWSTGLPRTQGRWRRKNWTNARMTKHLSGRRGELPVSAVLPLGTWKAHRSMLDKRSEPAGTFLQEDPFRFARLSRLLEPFALSQRVFVFVNLGGIGSLIARQPGPQRPHTHAPVVGETALMQRF